MNPDQRTNIEQDITALLAALAGCWAYYRVLLGLHQGGKAWPKAQERFPRLIDELWRATFGSLHAAMGTLIDRTPQTHSLVGLVKKLRKYNPQDAVISALCKLVEKRLNDASVVGIAKAEFWRNKSVAHNTAEGRDSDLYEKNKTTLSEIEAALLHLDVTLNLVTREISNTINDVQHQAKPLQDDAVQLMSRLSADV